MSSTAQLKAIPHALTCNIRIYYIYAALVALSGAFGDMSVIVPSLAMRLHAPDWIVVFPTVASTSIAYLPILVLGWIFRPDISRKKAYSGACVAMFLPISILVFALFFDHSRPGMVLALCVSCILFSMGQGLTILPCWDLFARIFPGEMRGLIMGRTAGLTQLISLFSASGAAWLIGSKSGLSFPHNYAVALAIFVTGGLIAAGSVLFFREEQYPGPCMVLPFKEYLVQLRQIFTGNSTFRLVLLGAVFASMITGVMPLMMLYAREHQGFSEEHHVSMLVFARPFVFIPLAILFGQMSARVGSKRVVALAAGIASVGMMLMPFFHGKWGIAPILLAACAAFTYSFSLVTVMNIAEAGKTHLYLTVYYLIITIPALSPLVFSKLIKPFPTITLGLLITLGIACAMAFLIADRKERRQAAPKPVGIEV